MPKYNVTVRRIVREDIEIVVEADTEEEAFIKAELESQSKEPELWEVYDCEYSSELSFQ